MSRGSPAAFIGLSLIISGCAASAPAIETGEAAASHPTSPAAESATMSPVAAATPSPCPTPGGTVPNVLSVPGEFAALETTTYWVDPDVDPCTPLRVLYTIPADGWLAWTGTFKPEEGTEDRRVGVSIVTVTNLVVDGCTDHSLADPPVGPTVDDLATALADLGPFLVTAPPTDVTIYGYSGKHLELSLPEMQFSECVDGEVISWDAPVLSYPFHGYLPRMIEEFWILDVNGSRLVIVASRVADSVPKDIEELQAVLDSVQIEP